MGIARILLVAVAGGVGYTGVPAVSLDSLADLTPQYDDSQSPYQVAAVTQAELTKTVAATGTIDATIYVAVGSQLSGQIVSLSADFNDTVRKGQVLAQLDDGTYRAQVNSALASLEGAKADVRVSEAKLARAAVHRLEAQLESAVIGLERTRIRSPIDGVIVGRNVTQGETLASTLEARTLFVVAGDLRRMEVHARIDESDISQIVVGQLAEFTVDSFPDRRFVATVTQIRKEPKIIQNVVTYVVVLVTANDDLALLPGMTAVAKIEMVRSQAPVTVPLAALRFRPQLQRGAAAPQPSASTSVVWTLRGGAPRPISVTVGSQDGERAEITPRDLHAGDRVLTGERPPEGLPNPGRQGNG